MCDRARGAFRALSLARHSFTTSTLLRAPCSPWNPTQLLALRMMTSSGGPWSPTGERASDAERSARDVGNHPSWLSTDKLSLTEVQEATMQSMIWRLEEQQRHSALEVVPWFLNNMPPEYFQSVDTHTRDRHLRALASMYQAGAQPELTLVDTDTVTFIVPDDYPGLFRKLMTKLQSTPHSKRNLSSVETFTALDGSLALDIFKFAPVAIEDDIGGLDDGQPLSEPLQSMYDDVSCLGSEAVRARIVPTENGHFIVRVAAANVIPKFVLERCADVMKINNLNIENVKIQIRRRPALAGESMPGLVLLSEICVSPEKGAEEKVNQAVASNLAHEVQLATKWLDDRTIALAKDPRISVSEAEVMHALCGLQHARLSSKDPYAFALSRLYSIVERPHIIPLALAIAQLFLAKFSQDTHSEIGSKAAALRIQIEESVMQVDEREFLNGMLDAVDATLRSNVHSKKRYALAMRLSPEYMGHGTVGTDLPFGVFYVSGRRFRGFHVRFRDIARGGLRVVTPRQEDQHAVESARQFFEAYNLAYAQQLKNKDIPEGGSKAVVLVEPHESDLFWPSKFGDKFMVRKCVRAFTDAMLDLITKNYDGSEVDYYGQDELVYLGPDEQILPEDIEWITHRAESRGYPLPAAFMSSKPGAGFNHKQYGVTSEGVAVYLNTALKAFLNQGGESGAEDVPFTVKITGGTDGDVAGNLVKILARDYGARVKVVGMCDGTATVEDPDGIPMQELLKLVDASEPLQCLDPANLGPNACFMKADSPDGIRMRDTMHNRVKADAFLPAGGRPNTININNYKDFIDENGEPSSGLIVEGANLFITPEAREALFRDAGVLVVKDSSANKCGVITSSYEILASMMLSTKEFLQVKDELVVDVLEKLRSLAAIEAELLFAEFKRDPSVPLPKHSERISQAITRIHDAVSASLQNLTGSEDLVDTLIVDHLPKRLAAPDFIKRASDGTVPQSYLLNIVASKMASKLVYREGLNFVEGLGDGALVDFATKYVRQEVRVRELVKLVEDSDMGDRRKEIVDLLLTGGVRAAVEAS